MTQIARKAFLTTAVFVGFANMSLAEEPIQKTPVEIVKVSTQTEDQEEKRAAKIILTAGGVFVGLAFLAYLKNKNNNNDYEDY